MKCIMCDRCKKIIEDSQQHRVVTCARPIKRRNDDGKKAYRGDDRQMNDIIWEKDLCTECAAALEEFTSASGEPDTASGETVSE